MSLSTCLLLWSFQKRFLSATVNCPRRNSSSLGVLVWLRLCERDSLDRDRDLLGLAECLPRDFDRFRDFDLLTDRRFDLLLDRDLRFDTELRLVRRLDLCRELLDELEDWLDEDDERDRDERRDFGVRDLLRLSCLGVSDLERDFDLDEDWLRA